MGEQTTWERVGKTKEEFFEEKKEEKRREAKQHQEKYSFQDHVRIFNKVANCIIASSEIQEILVETGKSIRRIRPQAHLVIFGSSGIAKSAILQDICERKGGSFRSSITKATMLGSWDKDTRTFTKPLIWEARKGIVAIDEFNLKMNKSADKDLMDVLLTSMENAVYSKKMHGCPDFEEVDGDLYCRVKGGVLTCKTRYSLVTTTMHNPINYYSDEYQAFCSRVYLHHFHPFSEDMYAFLDGEEMFTYKKIKVKKKYVVKKPDYEYIVKFMKERDVPMKLILRSFGELARFFCIMGKHDDMIYDYIIESKKVFNVGA